MNDRSTALISVRADGFVDGASYSGDADEEFRADAEALGFEVREVERAYAKAVCFTYVPIKGGTVLPA